MTAWEQCPTTKHRKAQISCWPTETRKARSDEAEKHLATRAVQSENAKSAMRTATQDMDISSGLERSRPISPRRRPNHAHLPLVGLLVSLLCDFT
jgi:hypothetical protein